MANNDMQVNIAEIARQVVQAMGQGNLSQQLNLNPLTETEIETIRSYDFNEAAKAIFTETISATEQTMATTAFDAYAFNGFSVTEARRTIAALGGDNARKDLIHLCSLVLLRGFNIDNIITRTRAEGITALNALKAKYHIAAVSGNNPKTLTLPRIVSTCSVIYFDIARRNLDRFNSPFMVAGSFKPFYLNNFIVLSIGADFGPIFESICIAVQSDLSRKVYKAIMENPRITRKPRPQVQNVGTFQYNALKADDTPNNLKIAFLESFKCIVKFAFNDPMCRYDPVTRTVIGDPNLACYLRGPGSRRYVIRISHNAENYLATGNVFQMSGLFLTIADSEELIRHHARFYDQNSGSYGPVIAEPEEEEQHDEGLHDEEEQDIAEGGNNQGERPEDQQIQPGGEQPRAPAVSFARPSGNAEEVAASQQMNVPNAGNQDYNMRDVSQFRTPQNPFEVSNSTHSRSSLGSVGDYTLTEEEEAMTLNRDQLENVRNIADPIAQERKIIEYKKSNLRRLKRQNQGVRGAVRAAGGRISNIFR